jgi:hypothetical protein
VPRYDYQGPAAAEWTLDESDFVVGVSCAVESRDEVWQGQVVEFPYLLDDAWPGLDTLMLRLPGREPVPIHPAAVGSDQPEPSALGFVGEGPPPF